MNATIKTYKGNANLFFNNNSFYINWDGYEWDNENEWNEWAGEVLSPVKDADNYDDIQMLLYIATNHLIKD